MKFLQFKIRMKKLINSNTKLVKVATGQQNKKTKK